MSTAMLDRTSGDPPRRVLPVLTCREQADDVASRIPEPRLPPQPRLIGCPLAEGEPKRLERLHRAVQVRALKVHDNATFLQPVVC